MRLWTALAFWRSLRREIVACAEMPDRGPSWDDSDGLVEAYNQEAVALCVIAVFSRTS